MQNRAFFTCQRVLTLSLSVGGMLNVLCASALSQIESDLPADTEETDLVIQQPEASRSHPRPTQLSSAPDMLPGPPPAPLKTGGAVEDAAVPKFSASRCQQAACLLGTVPMAIPLEMGEGGSVAQSLQAQAQALEPDADKLKTEQLETEQSETEQSEIKRLEVREASEEILLEDSLPGSVVKTVPVLEKVGPEAALSQANPSDVPDFLSDVVDESAADPTDEVLDDDLGTLRLQQTRSRSNEELGILRLLQTAKAEPPPPRPPIAFLGGRLGFFNTDNAFRSEIEIEDQIYQLGLTLYLFPKLSEKTSVYAIAETSLARYEVDYNELEVQAGLRHRILKRTFAQVGWRNQRLYTPGYREKILGVNYLDALISHRRILSKRAWADGFYQIRLGFAEPSAASRFRQTLIASVNYAATPKLRTSLLYQLELDDYLNIDRYDISQQFLAAVSYNITPESKISLFGGTRFGSSSASGVDLDDVFYGAGLNVNVPLF